ncbi:hypothetical protein NC651_025938 [Populus alba x Populus x berolinensis]|nr:hypothetical protein NC651_025938 [Populus alba x Populus x berolinensis]
MKVTVASRSGREVIKRGLELSDSWLICKRLFISEPKKFYPSRQRRTLPVPPGSKERPVVLSYKKNLKEYSDGNLGNLTVVFKDLGPQSYEFFGYKGERIIHPVQTYALYYWCFHYFKRIMETFFVHRFSHATSPLSNVYRNCAYYWTFGSFIAYYVNHPLYTPVSDLQMKIGFGFGLVCQLANLYCHMLLRNLRRPGGNGWLSNSKRVSLQYCDMCKLHNRDLSVVRFQRCNTDCFRLLFSCGCHCHHDQLGPCKASEIEEGRKTQISTPVGYTAPIPCRIPGISATSQLLWCIIFLETLPLSNRNMHLAGREYKVFTLKRFRISSFLVPKRTRPCDSYASTGSIVPVKRKGPSEPLKRTPTIMCWKR